MDLGEGPGVVQRVRRSRTAVQLDDIEPSVLGAIRLDGDAMLATALGYVHPHGATINWLAAI